MPPHSPFQLSVVIPTYNRRELLLRAIASVLDQDHARQAQIVVADDGSTDGTAAALQSRYGHDARVEIVSTSRRFTSAARNAGFAASTAPYVCFLDSDDCWLPGTLATFAETFERHPELAFVSIDGSTMPKSGQPTIARVVAGHSPGWTHAGFSDAPLSTESITIADSAGAIPMRRGDFFPAIIHADLFYLSGMVMRRQAVLDAGAFNERFRFFNDWEFFARLCLQREGAHLDYCGFERDTGRNDQISRGRPPSALARRKRFILLSLPRRFPQQTAAYARKLAAARDDANYFMARCLVRTPHRSWARRYLWRCLRRGYKVGRSLFLISKTFTIRPA